MGNVDQVFLEPMAVENLAAGAFHEDAAGFPGFPLVRGKALAGIPKRIFPRGRIPLMIETASRVGPFFISLKRSKEKAMQLTAIGLATALALTSTTAFAMGGVVLVLVVVSDRATPVTRQSAVAWFVLRSRLLP
jgi:hypothetical protein